MNLARNRLFRFLMLLAPPCAVAPAFALPSPAPDDSYLMRAFGEINYFDSTANYDVGGGSYTGLSLGRYYRFVRGQAGAEYWLTEDLAVLGQMGFARAESNDGTFTRTNGSPTELIAGARYRLARNPIQLVPEFWVLYPFNEFSDDTDEVLTGDGVLKVYGGAWAGWPLGQIRPTVEAGFLYAGDGLASHVLLRLGVDWLSDGWKLGLEAYGSKVVIDDDESNQRSVRDAVTSRVNGGSWKFYSVNPEVIGLQAKAEAPLGEAWRLGAAYDQTLNGAAAASGWTATLSIAYLWTPSSEPEFRPKTPPVLESPSREAQKFEPEQPKYDQTLFDELKPKPKPKPKRRPARPKTKAPKPVDVDKALEDVQKSLEN